MKIKIWVIWVVVVVFLASEAFLFSANRQKQAALVQLGESRQQAEELQAQVEQLKNANAGSEAAEISRLRADNQDLPRLRNQVTQLQTANKKLTQQLSAVNQQLNSTLTTAQQQEAQLQQIAVANQQAQVDAERNACINNLRQIDAAKQQWALENNKTAHALPSVKDITPYFKDGIIPTCPSGGTYTLNAVDELPSCSIAGHVLPQ